MTKIQMGWRVVLIGCVLGVLLLFALSLGNNPREIPSPLVGRDAPDIEASALDEGLPISLRELRGQWVLVNFWGSWCVSCAVEHPYLIELGHIAKNRSDFLILGVDFKDTREGAQDFLERHGDPGYRHAFDPNQGIAIDWGVYGAPESYLIDPQGRIRIKHTGPLFPGWFEQEVLPLILENRATRPSTR